MEKNLSLALLLLLLVIGNTANAQRRSGGARPAFAEGDNTLGFSAGFGQVHTYRGGADYHPAFAINYDHGIIGNAGPGTVGLGGIISWQQAHYRYEGGRRETWTNVAFGVRGTWHLTILKERNNKFDPYAGLTAGVRVTQVENDFNGNDHSDAEPFVGPFIGAKYNFVPQFGMFSELGFDVSNFRIGLHFNF